MAVTPPAAECYRLSFQDRLLLIGLLTGEQGSVAVMTATRQFADDLALTEDELERWEITVAADGSMTWRPDPAQERVYPFSAWRLKRVRALLQALNGEGRVTLAYLPLFGKFLPDALDAGDPDLAAELAEAHT